MGRLTKKQQMRSERKVRVRRKVEGTPERPRMAVFRSLKQTYVQVIDDATGTTLVHASTLDKDLKDDIAKLRDEWKKAAAEKAEKQDGEKAEVKAEEAPAGKKKSKKKGKKEEAPVSSGKKKAGPLVDSLNTRISKLVGETVAKRCLEKDIKSVAFDRSGYKYHGRVRALAEGARKGGLDL